MEFLSIALQLVFILGPYVLAAGAGAYVEAKYGQKALASIHTDLAAAKAEIAILRSKL